MAYMRETLDDVLDEELILINGIAKQTKRGVVQWILHDYLPLGILDKGELSGDPAVITQTFEYRTSIAGMPYELSITEGITLDDRKGDVYLTLTREVEECFMKIERSLSADMDYEEHSSEELSEKYKDHPVMLLSNTLIPLSVGSDIIKSVMSWARYYNQVDVDKKYAKDSLNSLCEKLFNEKRLLDFHQIVFDVTYRDKLISSLK